MASSLWFSAFAPRRWMRNAPLLWAGACVIAGLVLHAVPLDQRLFVALHAAGPFAPELWSALSVLGTGLAALLFVGAFGPARATLFARALLALLVGGVLLQLLKSGIASNRPLVVLGPALVDVIGVPLRSRSMPSGHAACAFALATLGWAAAREAGAGARAALLPFVAAVALAMARVAVGAHWPSDVLVGAGVGIFVGGVLAQAGRLQPPVEALARAMRGRAGSRLVAGALVAAAAGLWVAERDYPLAGWVHETMAAVGLLGAWAWWRLHPGHSRTMESALAARAVVSPKGS